MQEKIKTKTQLLDELAALREKNITLKKKVKRHQRMETEYVRRASELEEARNLLDSVIDNVPIVLFMKDAKDLRIVRWNKATEEFHGVKFDIVGKTDYDLFPKDQADFFTAKDREVIQEGKMVEISEEAIQTLSNKIRFLHTKKVPIFGSDGKPKYLLGIAEDITEQRIAERTLRDSEERYRAIFEQAADSIVLINPKNGRFVDFNDRAHLILGYNREEFIKLRITDVEAVESREEVSDHIQKIINQGSDKFETKHRTKSGEIIDVSVNSKVISIGDKIYFQSIWRDITERKKVETQLQVYQKQLQSLSSKLLLAEEQERRRLAMVLHDRISHSLAFAKIKLGILRDSVHSKELITIIDELRERFEILIQDTRSLTFEISPPILYELGLEKAIEWYIETVQEQSGISISLKDDHRRKNLNEETRTALFHAVRELVMNIVKHAGATNAEVCIQREDHTVRIDVFDNGIGFDVSRAISSDEISHDGFGLFSIRERLQFLNGDLKIRSNPGEGSQITIVAQLDQEG